MNMKRTKIQLDIPNDPRLRGTVAPESALSRWKPEIVCAAKEDDSNINIYGEVGEGWDGTGITSRLVSAILRKNKGNAVTVNINSPGGSFFEGISIYNLLRSHDAEVKVNVIGLAASAASIIAMAGDEVRVGENAFIMIHNAWTVAFGNKNDMLEVSQTLAKFDEAIIAMYEARTGISHEELVKMMDAETWMNGSESVDMGFADDFLDSDLIATKDKEPKTLALRKVDNALQKDGASRSQARKLIKELTGKPCAADTKPCAGEEESGVLTEILGILNNYKK